MGEETGFLFHVIYKTQECTLTLSPYDTVGDLKNVIFKKLGVAPNKQIIECWHKNPKTDSSTLISCCQPNDCNTLIVYNIEDNVNNVASLQLIPDGSNEEYVLEDGEISSIWSFKQYFSANFRTPEITIEMSTLQQAFEITFSEKKRILLLYFHNKTDPFATIFCEQLTQPKVQNILNRKFTLLCWDIENEVYKPSLIKALRKHDELKSFDRYIEEKICGALVVAPLEDSVKVTSILKGEISPRDFLLTLENFAEILGEIEESNQEEDQEQRHTFGSKEYQQHMLEMLGDRDYNSFDHHEHEHLQTDIGFAYFGPPTSETGYDQKQKKKIDALFQKILEENNLIAKWSDRVIISTIFVCMEPLPDEKLERAKKYPDYDPQSDLTPIPVFVLRKCKNSDDPCRVFIDDSGRVYNSWESYLDNNKLPKCEMVYPRNGRYESDDDGIVLLDRRLSPACDISKAILMGTDIGSAVGGIASGGVMIAAATIPAVAAAPLVIPIAATAGIAAGVYSLGRSIHMLVDRGIHKESLSFFESSEARGAYINIVAGSLGFVGSGANIVVSKLAAEGFNIGRGATAAVNAVNVVNLGAGGIGIANASYDILQNWINENETPSVLTIIQLSSSILFFGHAVYNYRSFSTVVEEAQTNALRDYQDSLRSNRHRKAFTKLLKETIRQNDGNVQKGRAEVISTIKNIQNKDETFAFLTRSNRAMNKNNVRFAANNGEITLNGVPIDMAQFNTMQKNEVVTFLKQLPNTPNPTQANIKNIKTYIKNFEGMDSMQLGSLALHLAKLFFNTDVTIKEKVMNAVTTLIQTLIGNPMDYLEALNRIFPNHSTYIRIVDMVNHHFQHLIDVAEEKYQRWLKTKNPEDGEGYFYGLALDVAKRTSQLFHIVTETYYAGTTITQFGLEKLLDYFYTWFAKQVLEYEIRQERIQLRLAHSPTPAPKKKCEKCGGEFYATE